MPIFRKHLTVEQKSLITVLERVCELLDGSEESDWSPLTSRQVHKNLQRYIRRLKKGRKLWFWHKQFLGVEFEVASTLQEIAMTNGWHKEFNQLADKFDVLIEKV